jgi:hypothetical protein
MQPASKRIMRRVLVVGVACLVLGTPHGYTQEVPSRPQTMLEDVETFVFERVNEVRTEFGLRTLESDPILTAIARNHSRDMLERDYLGHVNAEGNGPVQRVGEGHRRLVGEVSENVWSALLLEDRSPSEVAPHRRRDAGQRGPPTQHAHARTDASGAWRLFCPQLPRRHI